MGQLFIFQHIIIIIIKCQKKLINFCILDRDTYSLNSILKFISSDFPILIPICLHKQIVKPKSLLGQVLINCCQGNWQRLIDCRQACWITFINGGFNTRAWLLKWNIFILTKLHFYMQVKLFVVRCLRMTIVLALKNMDRIIWLYILPCCSLCSLAHCWTWWSYGFGHASQYLSNLACSATNQKSFHIGLNLCAAASFLSPKLCTC